jgi:hypothetical protein
VKHAASARAAGVVHLLALLAPLSGPSILRAEPAAPIDPRGAVHALILDKALPGDRELRVFLRADGGRFVDALATSPSYNGVAHAADASGLALDGNAIRGELAVTIGFDGFVPKDGKAAACRYTIEAAIAGAAIAGRYEGVFGSAGDGAAPKGTPRAGPLSGTVAPPPGRNGYEAVELRLENGAGAGTFGPKSWGDRVQVRLIVKDGAVVLPLIYGWGGRAQINYFESAIAEHGLTIDGRRLAGPITVRTTDRPRTFAFDFDGKVIGRQIGGTFAKRVDGKEAPGGPFIGSVQPMPAQPLDEAIYYLELHQAVADGKQLLAFVPRSQGRFGEGVAYSGTWNHTYHDADGAALTLDGATLAGTLKVTMNPDPYVPPDKKPIPADYAIAAKVIDGRIVRGTFTGTFKDRSVSGPVYGELAAKPPVPEPVSVHLKLDDGVNGGAPWHRRLYASFVAVQGKAEQGGWSNNKGGWRGAFKRAEVRFEGSRFTATLEGTVDSSQGALTGGYRFLLVGKVVGSELLGKVDTYREGRLTKSGTAFMGGFGPAGAPAPGAGAD